jgi:hypothetical protein
METAGGPGKRTLTEQLPVQLLGRSEPSGHASSDGAEVTEVARRGTEGPGGPLPHLPTIQALFGRHDVSSVQAHTGGEAAASANAIGADAYATGNHVVLGGRTDLHTVAHEAAHVVQQRGGVQLKGGVGEVGDAYERHADAVADRVVAGNSAEDLLDGGAGRGGPAVQRKEARATRRSSRTRRASRAPTSRSRRSRARCWPLAWKQSSAAFSRRRRSMPALRCRRR